MDVDLEDVLRFSMLAAMAAGHPPWEVREWSEGDLLHFGQYVQHGGRF